MKDLILLLAVLSCSALAICQSRQTKNASDSVYELYSWQEANGDWNFNLLFTTSSVKSVKVVFNKKTALRGVEKLEAKIAELPMGSTVLWVDRLPFGSKLPKVKGSEGLRYPPADIVEQVKRSAEAHHVDVRVGF